MLEFDKIGAQDFYGGQAGENAYTFSRRSRVDPRNTVTLNRFPIHYVDTSYSDADIQAVLTAMTSGGTVIFSPGSYTITAELLLANDYVQILGYGAQLTGTDLGSAILRLGDGNARLDGIALRGLRLTGAGTTESCLQVQYCPGVVIDGVHIDGTGTNGVLLYGNWVGTIRNSLIQGTFTNCIKASACPVTTYKNNGFTVRDNWIHGQTTGSYGLYIDDASVKFKSRENYYEKIANTGIYAASAVHFESYGDVFEAVAKIGYSANPNARWLSVTNGSDVTDGVEIAGKRAVLTFNQGTVEPTNNYVDFTAAAEDCYAEVPNASKYSDLGSNNIIINSDDERKWKKGNLCADGVTPQLYGFLRSRKTPSDGDYAVLYADCGKTIYTSNFTAGRTWTLPAGTAAYIGWWVRICTASSDYPLTIALTAGDYIAGLPQNQGVYIPTAYRSVVFELAGTNRWVVHSDSGPIIVPIASDATLGKGALSPLFIITNQGATGTVTITLPAATASEGDRIGTFMRVATQEFRIDPNTGEQFRQADGTAKGAGKYAALGTDGDIFKICNVVVDTWEVVHETSGVTYEA
jgi:hypothetical protein